MIKVERHEFEYKGMNRREGRRKEIVIEKQKRIRGRAKENVSGRVRKRVYKKRNICQRGKGRTKTLNMSHGVVVQTV